MRKACLILFVLSLASGLGAQEFKVVIGAGTSTYLRMWAPEYWWDWSGIKGGLNPFRNFRGGFIGGFGIEVPVREGFVLEVDAVYFSKGAFFRQTYANPGEPETTRRIKKEFVLRGFAFPVLAKARCLPRPFPYFVGGLDFSLITSHEMTEYWQYDSIGPYYYDVDRTQLIHETRKLDWGPVVGLGFEVKLPTGALDLELRYQAGLWDIHLEPGDYRVNTGSFIVVAAFRI